MAAATENVLTKEVMLFQNVMQQSYLQNEFDLGFIRLPLFSRDPQLSFWFKILKSYIST